MLKEYGSLVRVSDPKDAREGFAKLKLIGFSYCQLVYKPEVYTEEAAKMIKAAADAENVKIVALFAGYNDAYTKYDAYEDYKTAGINSKKYGKGRIEYVKQAAAFAKSMGVDDVLIHAGFIANNPFSSEYKYAKKVLGDLAGYCKDIGVNLLMETGGESPITLLRIIEDLDLGNIYVNLDTANLIMYGFGNPVDAVYTLKNHIRSMHVKDGVPPTEPNKLGKERPIGEGFVDFKRVFEELKKIDFNGPIVIEREIKGDQQIEDLKKSIGFLNAIID